MTKESSDRNQHSHDFARDAAEPEVGFFGEFVDFIVNNKKWWLTPLLIALLLIGTLVVLGGTGAAPFIYTLF